MGLKEKNLLKKFAATLKKFSAQGAKKVEYGIKYFALKFAISGKGGLFHSNSFLI